MKEILKKSLENSVCYLEYRNKIKDYLLQDVSQFSLDEQHLHHYTQLNEARMNRIEKTVALDNITINTLKSISKKYIWLLISEGWCGDSAQIVPILSKMVDASENIDLKIVFRDENNDLMNLFLTNQSRSIPKLIILDAPTLTVINTWGPRPLGATSLVNNYKLENGVFDENGKIALQKWYLQDKGISIQNEILELL